MYIIYDINLYTFIYIQQQNQQTDSQQKREMLLRVLAEEGVTHDEGGACGRDNNKHTTPPMQQTDPHTRRYQISKVKVRAIIMCFNRVYEHRGHSFYEVEQERRSR